jgi:cytochrome P450
VALEDFEIGGNHVKAGQAVLLMLGAANHDPTVFPDPGSLKLERPNARKHLSFGTGIHACIGASLARLQGSIAIGAIIGRSFIELAGEPRWSRNVNLRGLTYLPVALSSA